MPTRSHLFAYCVCECCRRRFRFRSSPRHWTQRRRRWWRRLQQQQRRRLTVRSDNHQFAVAAAVTAAADGGHSFAILPTSHSPSKELGLRARAHTLLVPPRSGSVAGGHWIAGRRMGRCTLLSYCEKRSTCPQARRPHAILGGDTHRSLKDSRQVRRARDGAKASAPCSCRLLSLHRNAA